MRRLVVLAAIVLGATGCRNVAYEHLPSSRVRDGLEHSDPTLDPFRVGPAVLTILVLQDPWGNHDISLYVNGADSANVQRLSVERVVARNAEGVYGVPVLDYEARELGVAPNTWVLNVAHLEGALQESIVDVEGDLTIEVTARFDGESQIVPFTLARRVSWWVVPP